MLIADITVTPAGLGELVQSREFQPGGPGPQAGARGLISHHSSSSQRPGGRRREQGEGMTRLVIIGMPTGAGAGQLADPGTYSRTRPASSPAARSGTINRDQPLHRPIFR